MKHFILFVLLGINSQAVALEIDDLGMGLTDSEKAAIAVSMESAQKISTWAAKINGRPYRRDAHAKATGCTRATFTVNGDIPEQFRYGVFSQPGKQYQSWVRFSNGDMLVQPDSKGDARGMAIKLMNVEGKRIADELTGAKTQDFVMTNYPVFFNANVFDYAEDIQFLAKKQRTKWFVSLFPPRLHPKRLYIAATTVGSKINTPFQPQYYSMLPYQLGNTALKFSAKPCAGMVFEEKVDTSEADFLTRQMSDHLSNQGACFDFMVQPQVPGAYMPIDDATVVWSEEKSPFIAIAKVNIPPQTITSSEQQQFCENLSFNPWNGVGQWQPLGSLNKARRVVYHHVSQYRHKMNDAQTIQPTSWCVDAQGEGCKADNDLIITKSTWPLPRCFDWHYQPVDGKPVASQCPSYK